MLCHSGAACRRLESSQPTQNRQMDHLGPSVAISSGVLKLQLNSACSVAASPGVRINYNCQLPVVLADGCDRGGVSSESWPTATIKVGGRHVFLPAPRLPTSAAAASVVPGDEDKTNLIRARRLWTRQRERGWPKKILSVGMISILKRAALVWSMLETRLENRDTGPPLWTYCNCKTKTLPS